MLALLDRQQELVVERASDQLLQNVAAINAQTSVLQLARRVRGERQRELAGDLHLEDDATFADLMGALPEAHAVLVNALVNENNQCLRRVRQRVGQNHLLLTRSMDLMQRLLATLMAATQTTVYQGDGKLTAPAAAGHPLCDTAG
jgi:flagellar biosynthesis/type III secretory pathway chaperone